MGGGGNTARRQTPSVDRQHRQRFARFTASKRAVSRARVPYRTALMHLAAHFAPTSLWSSLSVCSASTRTHTAVV